MKNQKQAFAVVRVDEPADPRHQPDMRLRVTVKEIVATQVLAEAEVERLTRLNSDKGCAYFWQVTRLVGDFGQESSGE